MITPDTKLDSREGIQFLFDWARAGRFVLNRAHEALAKKHDVSTAGVRIARPISLEPGSVLKIRV